MPFEPDQAGPSASSFVPDKVSSFIPDEQPTGVLNKMTVTEPASTIPEDLKRLGTFAVKGVATTVPGAVLGANYWANRIAGSPPTEAMKFAVEAKKTVEGFQPQNVPEFLAEAIPQMAMQGAATYGPAITDASGVLKSLGIAEKVVPWIASSVGMEIGRATCRERV